MSHRSSLLLLSLACLWCCALLALFVSRTSTFPFDAVVGTYIFSAHSDVLTRLMLAVTNVASEIGLTLITVVVCVLLGRLGRVRDMLIFLGAMIAGALSHIFIKVLIQEHRPVDALATFSGWSYPSGHATMAAVTFFMILSLFFHDIKRAWVRPTFVALCVFAVFCIGLSRVYLGAHFLSDVIGGYLLGLGIVFLSRLFVRRVLP